MIIVIIIFRYQHYKMITESPH